MQSRNPNDKKQIVLRGNGYINSERDFQTLGSLSESTTMEAVLFLSAMGSQQQHVQR